MSVRRVRDAKRQGNTCVDHHGGFLFGPSRRGEYVMGADVLAGGEVIYYKDFASEPITINNTTKNY